MVVTDDDTWQIQIGRFLQPIYAAFFRDRINAPWLIGILSLLYLGTAIYLIIDLFEVKSNMYIILISGLLTANISMICLNASYLQCVDNYTCSLLLSVLALWITCRFRFGWIGGAFLLTFSMGLYQSYYAVFITLAMMFGSYSIFNGKTAGIVMKKGLQTVLCALTAVILYKIGTEVAVSLIGDRFADSYNGIAGLGNFTNVSIVFLLKTVYIYFIDYFFSVNLLRNQLVVCVNIVLLLICFLTALRCLLMQKIGVCEELLLLIISIVFPFGANLISFISKGYAYELTTYSFNLVYLFPLLMISLCDRSIIEKESRLEKKEKLIELSKLIIIACCAILILSNVITANQTYTKKKLVYDSTQSIFTRLLCQIEMTEGYVPGETQVALLGSLQKNTTFSGNYEEFNKLNEITACDTDMAITYDGYLRKYFQYIMNTQIFLLSDEEEIILIRNANVEDMAVFPQAGSCRMIDNILVVKLSEE